MKKIFSFLFFVFIIGVLYIVIQGLYEPLQMGPLRQETIEYKKPSVKEHNDHADDDKATVVNHELTQYIGWSEEEVINEFGQPNRTDMTPYGYEWYIYTNSETSHIQFGLKDGRVKTLFMMGDGISLSPLQLGQDYEKVEELYPIEQNITYRNGFSMYTFKLKEEDLRSRPLIQLADDIFLQAYFDTHTNTLMAVRLIDADILLQQRMYELEYRGPLPEEISLNDDQWEEIQRGAEKQIIEMTNVVRNSFQVPPVEWHEEVAEVAKGHSIDMYVNEYFAHERPNGDGLKERLDEGNIRYSAAGENIAAQHTDSIAAMFGWLNSEGHREALLSDVYTHLGVGVYRYDYTQNFISR